jgi:hypothetical protein
MHSGKVSGMGKGLEAYHHLARTGQGEEDMAEGSNHAISKDDNRILKLTYDLALATYYRSGKRGRKLAIYTHQLIVANQVCLGS